jgi:MFS family permease
VLRSLPKIITTLGIFCVIIGVAWGFVDERTHSRFEFFTDYAGLFLITLAVGIILSAGGALAWTRHFDRRKRLKVAGCVFLAGLLAMVVAPDNVHGPGMLLVLAAVCAWILSVVLAVIAVASHNHSSGRPSESR